MNCAQVKERLVDFLYDEMPKAARAEFADHLQACADCKATVADYERMLGSARAALGGPLAQEPPARVHLAIMAAAQAAVKAAPANAKARPSADAPGFLARLWSTPWLLPAFGAASVATVVFLVRVLKNPEVLLGQHPHAIEERSLATPEPLPPTEPTRARQPPAAAAQAKPESNFDDTRTAGSVRVAGKYSLGEGQTSGSAPNRFAEPPPPRQAVVKSKKSVDDPLAGTLKKEDTQRTAQLLRAPVGAKAARVTIDDLDGLPGMTAGPEKKAPVPAADHAVQPMRDYPATTAAGAPSPPTTPPASPHKEMKQAEAASEVSAEMDNGVAARDRKGKGNDKTGLSLDESIRIADRLYASEDWIAAAQAYRDLLRRFPSHKDAPKWRARMNESLVAEQQRQWKIKKTSKTSDDLEGPKQ